MLRLTLLLLTLLVVGCGDNQSTIMHLTQRTLMNEVRETIYPTDGDTIATNPARLMWPDKFPHLGKVFDGVEQEAEPKPRVTYRVRVAPTPDFSGDHVIRAELNWAFFPITTTLNDGRYYWQYAYVDIQGREEWSDVFSFIVEESTPLFNPPSFECAVDRLSPNHPRVLFNADEWESLIYRNRSSRDAQLFKDKAAQGMKYPLRHISRSIDTVGLDAIENEVQRKSALISRSRKVVDREEQFIEALIRSYALTLDERYYTEAMRRLREVLSWRDSEFFVGGFNHSTLLSMSTSAYDVFYDKLNAADKKLLLENIRIGGESLYDEFVNHVENRIADNHVWQMTLRILTKAAFATIGDLDEAMVWGSYCYNLWLARLPGLNDDGAWHNGDTYFHVNIKTLVEVPELFSRITGFDFFADEWYTNNAMYVIYHQPPFSKSGGHGSSHETKRTPMSQRVAYADAISRECGNRWLAGYVEQIEEGDPDILLKGLASKSGDLTWYRCTTRKPRPAPRALSELPMSKIFPQTGVATMHTAIGDYAHNAMLSFRSSPYGSSSHALANQNAFNTFYAGEEIFYSSGHRTGFTDNHMMYSYRNSRAHNTILVNGMGQRIGVDGYGWIPRQYEGEKISYLVGDASNAYGKIGEKIWLQRAELSEIEFTPENGWDENKLKMFRRHVIQLGASGLFVIYDELEAVEAVEWSYLLHTRNYPMLLTRNNGHVEVQGVNNRGGRSIATLYSSSPCDYDTTSRFFSPAVSWIKGGTYPDNYHFTAKTHPCRTAQFLTIIDTHGEDRRTTRVTHDGNKFIVGEWSINASLTGDEGGAIKIRNATGDVSLDYDYHKNGAVTTIHESVNGEDRSVELYDSLPKFEI